MSSSSKAVGSGRDAVDKQADNADRRARVNDKATPLLNRSLLGLRSRPPLLQHRLSLSRSPRQKSSTNTARAPPQIQKRISPLITYLHDMDLHSATSTAFTSPRHISAHIDTQHDHTNEHDCTYLLNSRHNLGKRRFKGRIYPRCLLDFTGLSSRPIG